jgi:hypothetical protein
MLEPYKESKHMPSLADSPKYDKVPRVEKNISSILVVMLILTCGLTETEIAF